MGNAELGGDELHLGPVAEAWAGQQGPEIDDESDREHADRGDTGRPDGACRSSSSRGGEGPVQRVLLVTARMVACRALAHLAGLGHYVPTTEELLSRAAEGADPCKPYQPPAAGPPR